VDDPVVKLEEILLGEGKMKYGFGWL